MKSMTLKAPAKVNYLLDVIRRRPDGYHDLRMVMQRIGLCDDVYLELTETPQICVECGKDGIPDGPGNIAWKAARALLDLSGKNVGVRIGIDKRIPIAAGLGGGSSDAATVLMGLNELLKLNFSDQKLMEIGVKLGADVPFFIFKRTALAEGIGEVLQPMPDMPRLWVVLVNPGVPVSTAWVYQSLRLTTEKELAKLPQFFGTAEDVCSILSNDLESVTIPAFPVIAELKDHLLKAGAVGAMMSGSGPTVFGLFRDRAAAERAVALLPGNDDWFKVVAETL